MLRDRAGFRARLLWSLAATILLALVLAPLTVIALRRSAGAARDQTLNWARDASSAAVTYRATGMGEPPGNTWAVNPIDGWAEEMGETWTEPPLLSLANDVVESPSPVVQEYDYEGAWLSYSQWVGGNDVLVSVVGREDEIAAISADRWRLGLLSLGLVAAGGFAAFIALGRMQAPVRRAHTVNREFIADAAHELRTPLSIIQASAGFALSRERSADEYRESLTEILDASERAGASVGELLEFARLEAGQASLRLAPLRLDLLVEEVAASVRVDDVTIEAVPSEAVVVEADYNLMRQVIENITRNAAARADKVSLSTRLDARQAVIEIVDDGPGFDPGIIDHVFERFRRGDRSGSVGLGMAIARTVVELHGGTCSAANRPDDTAGDDVGGGAMVTVRLPYKSEL